MPDIQVMLEVAPHIAMGLASGRLERVGGVIRESGSKQVVAWLREGRRLSKNSDPATALPRFLFQSLLQGANLAEAGNVTQQANALKNLAGSLGALNNVFGVANLAATARSHHLITLRLQAIQNMLAFSTRLSMLHFTLSGFGLLMMIERFAEIDALLKKTFQQVAKAIADNQKAINKIELKAALECARVVMEAKEGAFKESMAASLDFLLINAREHLLSDFQSARCDKSSKQEIEIAQQRLTQAMHLDETRVRSFLEVGQNDLARSVMKDRLEQYRKFTRNYVGILLGKPDQRAVYFNKNVIDTDLRRYLLIEQWLRDEEDILWDILLEQRKQFWDASVENILQPDRGINLPMQAPPKEPTQHLDVLAGAETAIENFQRFEGFALEFEAIERLGISYSEWEIQQEEAIKNRLAEKDTDIEEYDDYLLLVERDSLDAIA